MTLKAKTIETGTYSVPEAAKRLGVSRGHAYEVAKSGTLAGVPVVKVGSRMMLSRAAVERLLQ